MIAMKGKPKKNPWGKITQIRVHRDAKTALSLLKVRFSCSPLQLRGKELTEEAIFNLLCLWAAAQDVTWLEGQFAPHAEHLDRALAAHEETPDDPDGRVEGITITTKNRAPARGKGKPGGGKPPGTPGSGLKAKGRGKAS